jgi:5-formyltetrahydrofolate cyclo-ligase
VIKKQTRQRLRQILASIEPDQLAKRSQQACDELCKQKEFRKAEVLMVFLSLPKEIDTTPLVLRAWQERKRVLAPKVSWEQRRMLPIEIESLSQNLATTQMGIREPVNGQPFPVANIDLVIVPGLGFDPFGHRLGRGRGFYDRFLGQPDFKGTRCAIAFEEQFVDMIPTGPYDVPVDMLVTDKRVRRFRR